MMIDERDRALLEQRALQLARPRAAEAGARTDASGTSYPVFERAGVQYAIHPRFVFEVARVLAPTPLPLAEGHWLGVSSLHGELIALADLALLLGHAAPPQRESVGHDRDLAERRSSLVLVLGNEQRELGLLVDHVLEARPLLEPLTRIHAGDSASQLLLGTTKENVRVLSGETLLSDPRLFIEANHLSEP